MGSKRLTSVTKVLGEVLPDDYTGVDVDVVENARERGTQVDQLITAYVRGEISDYPIGTREDSIDLFERLFLPWWWKQGFISVYAQEIAYDDEIAGMLDLRCDGGIIYDVKCTYELLPKHHIQVAAYSELCGGGFMKLLHLSKRFKTAKVVDVPVEAREDWRTVRDFWRLKRRLEK